MAQQTTPITQNNFIAGLKTEYTGLNFPANAATDTDNCVYSLIGDVDRRLGFDFEDNYDLHTVDRADKAITTYVWTNVASDGNTQILVKQIGNNLYFFKISDATANNPISNTLIPSSTVDLTLYVVANSLKDPSTIECEYASGNGYLFVYHPYCEPFYCAYTPTGNIATDSINIKTRDFHGMSEGKVSAQLRPPTLTDLHKYNLMNQGWTAGGTWTTQSTSGKGLNPSTGVQSFTVNSGMTVTVGQTVNIYEYYGLSDSHGHWFQHYDLRMTGNVQSYSGTTMTIFVNWVNTISVAHVGYNYAYYTLTPTNTGYIDTWKTQVGNYPANSDIWWNYKNSSGAFDPSTMVAKVTSTTGPAANGHFILDEFNQQRALQTGISSINDINTFMRPRTGTWFQGRVWFTGVDDAWTFTSTDPANPSILYDWSENIYFSTIVEGVDDFSTCYQKNDPTSEELFDELATDGGVITIQGCGKIYKLFPIQNGVLVFAANGIWFITGSQGIGFTANDYTITKLSEVQSISSTSFVNVQGYPVFWNEEGIYTVTPTQNGSGLQVNSITVDSILSFYGSIPKDSKRYVRGSYNPIDYVIQWTYRDTQHTDVTNRYDFNRILCYNTYNKAFYPYTITGDPHIHSVNYIYYPRSDDSPSPGFKYLTSYPDAGTYEFTFSEEKDEDYVDFESTGTGSNYISYFITGYLLPGKGLTRSQPGYIMMYSRADEPTAYKIQGVFDFAISGNSGQWSTIQLIQNNKPNYGMIFRRHKLRGHGYVLQIKVTSVDGEPFDIMGWAINDLVNAGV